MRALSLTRPWTELVLCGAKDVENRTWRCPPRQVGQPLIVHGAKSWDSAAMPRILESAAPTGYLGIVTVTGCHHDGDIECSAYGDQREICSEWAFGGQWHWTIEKPRRFPEPIPGPGRLGLFEPPVDVVNAARALL